MAPPGEIKGREILTGPNAHVRLDLLTLNPYGIMDDGSFELTVLGDFSSLRSKPELVGLLLGAIRGKPDVGHPKVTYLSGAKRPPGSSAQPAAWRDPIRTVDIEFQRPVPVEADGDILGETDFIKAGMFPFMARTVIGQESI